MSNGAMPSNKTRKWEGVEAKNIKFANMRGGGGMEVETNPKNIRGFGMLVGKYPERESRKWIRRCHIASTAGSK